MNYKEMVLDVMTKFGAQAARALQEKAPTMTGTEIIQSEDYLPAFNPEKQYLNVPIGYVCRTPSGNAVKLIQPYDSTIYTQEPEELPAQWGFYWSQDPKKAKPFVAIATSPYNKNDCCLFNGAVYRSKINNNVYSPADYAQGWEPVENATT